MVAAYALIIWAGPEESSVQLSHLVILPLDLLNSCLLHGWKMLKIEHSRRGYCVGVDRFTES